MATNQVRWVRNLFGAPEPLVMLGSFQAGATQAIKQGEILEFTGDSNTDWVPIDSDFAMDGNIAVANEEIVSGDRAGYYEIIVPRPGDVFEFELAAAGATTFGTYLFYSSSEKVTATAGTNVLGVAVGQANYPDKQGHLTKDIGGDAGTTVRSQTHVQMTFNESASLFAKLTHRSRRDLGDVGGFSGVFFSAGDTELQFFVDGTKVGSIGTDGSWDDEVT